MARINIATHWKAARVSRGDGALLRRAMSRRIFDATPAEQGASWRAVGAVKRELDRELGPAGYNVGFNAGEAAGQTVMHAHLHLIPRFSGDTPDSRGGVRGVIPDRQKY